MRSALKHIALCLVMVLTALTAGATVYNWSDYHLTFEAPDDGFVTHNSINRLEVRWEDMLLSVRMYTKDRGDDKKLLTNNLQSKALGYNMYDLKNGKIKVKGFKKTYSIEGTMPDGSRVIIVDLVSKTQNLIIEVTVNYLFGNRETVEDMIKSFAENNGNKPNHEKKRQKVQSKQDADRQQKQLQQEEKKRQEEREKQERKKREKLYDA